MQHHQRGKLGLAFGGVAFLGVALGFAVSSRLAVPGKSTADTPEARELVKSANAPVVTPPDTKPTAPPAPPVAAPTAPPLPAGGIQPQGPSAGSFSPLVKSVGPAVVHVSVEKLRGDGLGTGFVISADGYLLTNEHVVGGAQQISVRWPDGSELPAQLVGADAKTDIAVLKVEAPGPLPYMQLGDSDTLEVGDWVIAIGSPLGLDHTVTAGIVSAKQRRHISPSGRRSNYEDFIQTDASINPGNSGGPLINTKGEVIGINSAVSMQGQGIGFAIPINMAKILLPQLKSTGKVDRSWLGVSITQVDPAYAKKLALPDAKGAFVADVVAGGPAAKAGLSRGDVILAFDGKLIDRSDDLPWLASTAGIGKEVNVLVVGSDGQQRTVKVILERSKAP